MDDYTIVTVNGVDYYVPSNMVQYIGSDGVSQYSSNFYGYRAINTGTDTLYPRIQFRPLSYPILYISYNNYSILTNATVTFSAHSQYVRFTESAPVVSSFLLLVIAFFVMFRRFK